MPELPDGVQRYSRTPQSMRPRADGDWIKVSDLPQLHKAWAEGLLSELRKLVEKYARKYAECKADEKRDHASGKLDLDRSYRDTWNYYEGLQNAYEESARLVEAATQATTGEGEK